MSDPEEIIGQDRAVTLLRRMREAGRVPHGLLFHGAEGTGKGAVARRFAAELQCEAGPDDAPCGSCGSCVLTRSGGHPDLLIVTRLPKKTATEPDDLRHFIVVEQVRELTRIAAMAPRRGKRRVFVVDPADRMNVESQNALLKTLEEPPGGAVLILVAARAHLLLPTVRSRCFTVGFATMRVAELARRLSARGLDADEALTRAALSGGRPSRALSLDLEQLTRRRAEVLGCLESLTRGPIGLADLGAMAASLAGRNEDHLLESLDLLGALLRDAGRAGRRPDDPALVHADLRPRLESLGRFLDPVRAAELVRRVERLRADLRLNVNRTLVAESLLAAVAGGPLP